MAAIPGVRYRESYVEKDRCVRNSTAVQVPGVDIMQGFTLSKTQFEHLFLQAAESMDDPNSGTSTAAPASGVAPTTATAARPPPAPTPPSRGRKLSAITGRSNSDATNDARPSNATAPSTAPASPSEPRAFRAPPTAARLPRPELASATEADDYADVCRKHAASLQRASPPDFDGAGEFFEKAVDARARHGLYCSAGNADAHVEYAQNLSKRGLIPEAEYHLRTAADIYRVMDARRARKYGDVLLYLAVVIDRQGRLAEAENFYRSALAVYRANKLSDDNVRVAIDSLSNNLRAQGRADEVDAIVRRHFLGALD